MKVNKTFIDGLFVIEPEIFKDERGVFFEFYNKEKLNNYFDVNFIQDNESRSHKGVIRGLHFQKPPFDQNKLVRCITGKILDVAVDLRKKSKTYGKFFSIELSSHNKKQLFIPKGFAHGFQVLSKTAIVSYKVDNHYSPKSDSGIIWNDRDLLIDWKKTLKPILSQKDLKLILFKDIKSPF